VEAHGAERKLAAILSADVVGYSRLMAEDEDATVRALCDHRDAIAALVGQHRGRVVDSPGDNVLAEFPAATDAVQCAVEIQRVLEVRNAPLPESRRMQFRIGVHLGELRVEGDRVYGDGVNIAARLEGLAEPGAICISGTVHEQVRHRLTLAYDDLREQSFKNIPEPLRVYRIRPGAVPVAEARSRPGPRAGLAAAVLVLAVAAVWALWTLTRPEGPAPGFGDGSAIAVLPFDNLSGDPEQAYFADGIAEDLITRLADWRIFPVIARNSSFTYKGEAVDVKRVSRELGVRYLVEGSVRRAGERVRISVQLIEATTGHHVWAETYDRDLRDVFALQDEITQKVVASIVPELERAEIERAVRKEARSLDAYDYDLRGRWHFFKSTREDNRKARALFEKSLEADPQYALAWAYIGLTHSRDVIFEWTESREASIDELERAARRCVAIDKDLPACQIAVGVTHNLREEPDTAIAAYERAVRLNPNDLGAHGWLGMALVARGRAEEGIAELEQALRLSPKDPQRSLWLVTMGMAHFAAERYEMAAEWAQRTLEHDPHDPWAYEVLAASYARLGRIDEARAALEEQLRIEPDLTLDKVRRQNPGVDPEFLEPFLDGLRKAGLEE
jgi:adenylate cyclase